VGAAELHGVLLLPRRLQGPRALPRVLKRCNTAIPTVSYSDELLRSHSTAFCNSEQLAIQTHIRI
jgi:hypothetical protein